MPAKMDLAFGHQSTPALSLVTLSYQITSSISSSTKPLLSSLPSTGHPHSTPSQVSLPSTPTPPTLSTCSIPSACLNHTTLCSCQPPQFESSMALISVCFSLRGNAM